MPRRRLPMGKITEVLRLNGDGVSVRDIAVSVGVGKTTVYEYLVRADAAGIGWRLPEAVDEEGLQSKLFPPRDVELAVTGPGIVVTWCGGPRVSMLDRRNHMKRHRHTPGSLLVRFQTSCARFVGQSGSSYSKAHCV
jgi:hypothetical protein